MRRVKVLIFTDMRELSGGNKRITELVKRGEKHGVDYVSAIDHEALATLRTLDIPFPQFQYNIDLPKAPTNYLGIFLPSYTGSLAKSASQVAELAVKERVDLILAPHEFMNQIMVARASSSLSGVPWTALLQLTPVVANPRIPNRMERLRLESIFDIARGVTFLSVSSTIVSYLQSMNPKFKAIAIQPGVGVDLAKFREAKPSDEKYDGIYFARLIPEKGYLDLVSIWKLVIEQKPNSRLAVCGPSTLQNKQRFLREVARLGLQENIFYLGQMKEDDLISLIKATRLVLYPSYLDSFAMVVLESLACGSLVVAYSTAAIQAHYKDVQSVFKIKPGDIKGMADVVLKIISDPKLGKSLKNEALKFSEGFDWDSVMEAEKLAYFRVLET